MEFTCKITDVREKENAFSVMLVAAPDFPNNGPIKDIVRQPKKIVIAANDDGGKWGWIGLSGAEKHCIGDKLVELGVPDNEWRYCELYES